MNPIRLTIFLAAAVAEAGVIVGCCSSRGSYSKPGKWWWWWWWREKSGGRGWYSGRRGCCTPGEEPEDDEDTLLLRSKEHPSADISNDAIIVRFLELIITDDLIVISTLIMKVLLKCNF